jgi:hypothetical protein
MKPNCKISFEPIIGTIIQSIVEYIQALEFTQHIFSIKNRMQKV